MEALAALSIACNLMQVISFTGETIILCKNIYKRGSAETSLEGNAKTLRVLIQSLDESLQLSTSQVPPDTATLELQVLAQKCLNAVTRLSSQLGEIGTGDSRGSVSKTIVTVSKHLWRSGHLRRLQKEINGYQKILESGLLVRICTANEAAAMQSREEFKTLNTTLQHFISALSKNEVHFSQQIQTVESRIELAFRDAEIKRRLLGSLKYKGMNDRRNTIKKHHKTTFEWIFGPQISESVPRNVYFWSSESDSDSDHSTVYSNTSGPESIDRDVDDDDDGGGGGGDDDNAADENRVSFTSERDVTLPWDDFVAWLQSDDSLYWVSGKPGSGKSTLMLFLLRDARTQTLLNQWRTDTRIISHFLLSSGNPLQRSVKGIYLSLLHQILGNDLNEDVNDILTILARKIPRLLSKDDPDDWAVEELERVMKLILKSSKRATCMFIDGLDELVPSEIDEDIWDFVRSVKSIPQLKICLSSRPEPTFKMHLENVPKLRIHSLTEGDIRTYATDFLKSKILPTRKNTTHCERERFVRTICERSDGVFLWVYLVLGRLQRGLTNGDSIDVLNERLEQTPKELHDLFNDMWSRLGQDAELSDYISTAATYFRLVETARTRIWPLDPSSKKVTVADIMLATDLSFLNSVFDGRDLCPGLIEERCETVLKNLESRCAGLLECHKVELECMPREDCPFVGQTCYHELGVQFIHRSASEYIFTTPEGSKILAYDTSTSEDRLALLCRVDVAVASLWGFSYYDDLGSWSCLTITEYLEVLSGYGKSEHYSYSLSKGLKQAMTALGGLIYTDARIRNVDFLPFCPNNRVSGIFGKCSPDFIMVLCHSFSLGLVPTYIKMLGSGMTTEYLGYLVLCICKFFVPRTLDVGDWEAEKRSTEEWLFTVESGIQYLIESRANLNIKGLSSIDLDDILFDDLSLNSPSSAYSHLDTPVSVLILYLYRSPSSLSLLTALRMISEFLRKGAKTNQEMVFFSTESTNVSTALCFLGFLRG